MQDTQHNRVQMHESLWFLFSGFHLCFTDDIGIRSTTTAPPSPRTLCSPWNATLSFCFFQQTLADFINNSVSLVVRCTCCTLLPLPHYFGATESTSGGWIFDILRHKNFPEASLRGSSSNPGSLYHRKKLYGTSKYSSPLFPGQSCSYGSSSTITAVCLDLRRKRACLFVLCRRRRSSQRARSHSQQRDLSFDCVRSVNRVGFFVPHCFHSTYFTWCKICRKHFRNNTSRVCVLVRGPMSHSWKTANKTTRTVSTSSDQCLPTFY